MNRTLLVLALLVPASLPLRAQENPTSPPADLRSLDDWLWLAQLPDDAQLDTGLRAAREQLRASRVPSVDEAQRLAIGYKLEKCGGVLAEEGAKVVGLLMLGVNLPGVARKGDFVWVVRFSALPRGVTQEIWVGSTSGGAKCMLPFA